MCLSCNLQICPHYKTGDVFISFARNSGRELHTALREETKRTISEKPDEEEF